MSSEAPSPDLDEPEAYEELTVAGIDSIRAYQTQMQIAMQLWGYFGRYSSMLIVLAFVLVLGKDVLKPEATPQWIWLIPPVAYLVFTIGNHRALTLTLEELHILRGVALNHTRLGFKGIPLPETRRFQLLLTIIVVALYAVMAWIALDVGGS